MSKLFNQVQFNRIKKAKFDLSHERKMSMKMGTLTPMFLQEVLPGDSFRVNTELFMRLQPMITPVMHRIQVKTDFYFVPNRLVYDKWHEFITGGEDGASAEVHPYVLLKSTSAPELYGKGTLSDFMGVPNVNVTTLTNEIKLNALPFRAYQLIYNEYYRDQNLQAKVNISKGGGLDPFEYETMSLRQRAWEKDYFTSCLPWAQKSQTQVTVPGNAVPKLPATWTDVNGVPGAVGVDITGGADGIVKGDSFNIGLDTVEEIGITINDLRKSARLQEWLEKNARAGSRYIESILAHFGVLGKDSRLQRPEYLGGGMNPVVVSEVLSTYQAGDDTGYPQGTMAGHGISTGSMMGFKKSFDEHGWIIGLCTTLPKTAYFQGLPRELTRFDKLDYAWPTFSQLGEQEVLNKELYLSETDAQNDETFGYQSRYAEYKYKPSTVHGDMRTSLLHWHQARNFTSRPTLSDEFIKSSPDKRIFAVETQTEDELICQLYNRVDALRPLPYFNQPNL